MVLVGRYRGNYVAKQGRNWRRREAKEALRQQLLGVREMYDGEFSLSDMAQDTGVSYETIKGFARDPETDGKATTPRSHKALDAIADYLESFEGGLAQESIQPGLSHPTLNELFMLNTPEESILRNSECRGLYIGMGVGRRFKKLVTSVLAIDERDNRLDYAEHDASTAICCRMEGQCFLIGGNLALIGVVKPDMDNVQLVTLRNDGLLGDFNRVLVGAEYHTGWPGRGSSIARTVYVRVDKNGIDGNLMDAVAESETLALLQERLGHDGLAEDVAWERMTDVFTEIIDGIVAKAVIRHAKTFIGPFDQASGLI